MRSLECVWLLRSYVPKLRFDVTIALFVTSMIICWVCEKDISSTTDPACRSAAMWAISNHHHQQLCRGWVMSSQRTEFTQFTGFATHLLSEVLLRCAPLPHQYSIAYVINWQCCSSFMRLRSLVVQYILCSAASLTNLLEIYMRCIGGTKLRYCS